MRTLSLGLVLLFGCASTSQAHAQAAEAHVVGAVDSDSLADLAEQIENAPKGNFSLYFRSPGGSVFDGLAFIDVMEAAQHRGVRFVCTAELAASMGAVIFSACDVRYAVPRGLFLIHTAASDQGGNARARRESADTLEALSDAMFRQICRVVNISFAELKRRADGRDYWLDSGRALEIGLIQRILP